MTAAGIASLIMAGGCAGLSKRDKSAAVGGVIGNEVGKHNK